MQDEPRVLPARVPNLLVNGSSGIAVSIATKIPPHNLKEVVAGLHALIDKPDITVAELMQHIPAPDFPTGMFWTAVSHAMWFPHHPELMVFVPGAYAFVYGHITYGHQQARNHAIRQMDIITLANPPAPSCVRRHLWSSVHRQEESQKAKMALAGRSRGPDCACRWGDIGLRGDQGGI